MANTTTRATLGGFPLLASSKVEWKMTEGVRYNSEVFSMIPEHADALLKSNDRPVSLIIQPRKSAAVQIDFLYVLREAPGENPNVKKVLVADRRWMWDHNFIERDYNIRRNVGNLRTHDGNNRQLDVTTPQTRYWPWSLHEPVNEAAGAWIPSESLADVLGEVLETEEKTFGVVVSRSVLEDGKDKIDRIPWEGVSLKDGGATALGRMIAMLPAVGIRLETNGSVTIYSKYNKSGKLTGSGNNPKTELPASVAALGVPIDGFGKIVTVNNRLMRPRKITVKFLREIETMFESVQEAASGQTQAQPGVDTRYMVNVGQVTEPFLSKGSFTDAQGTWMPFDDILGVPGLISRWPDLDGYRMTQEYIRRALLPYGVPLWASMDEALGASQEVDWSNRRSMLGMCYRRTYQINDKWMSRIRSMRPYRVSVVNQATGTLAPAAVYADYSILWSKRKRMGTDPTKQRVYEEVRGYQEKNPSPAYLKILDEGNGIILLDWMVDPIGHASSIVPSLIDNNPNGDISNADNLYYAVTADAVPEGGTNFPAMAATHRVKVIFTCVPASPNNDQKLHSIEITPESASEKLGYSLGQCVGPEMEVFVGPNVCTCKIKWDDARQNDIEKCFGIGVGKPNLTGLIMNEGKSTPGTGASLNTVATAYACSIYASLVDRVEGAQAGIMNPGVKLDGWADLVTHSLSPLGHLRTFLSYPSQIPRMSIASFLDQNTRNAIYKLAQPSSVV